MRDLDRLERLTALRDSGALTDDEFAAEKAKILDAEPVRSRPLEFWIVIGAAALALVVVALIVGRSVVPVESATDKTAEVTANEISVSETPSGEDAVEDPSSNLVDSLDDSVVSKAGSTTDDWLGTYSLVDGSGVSGKLKVEHALPPDAYNISIGVSSERCDGEIEGEFSREGETATLSFTKDESDACQMTISKRNNAFIVTKESGCENYHGAYCSFLGTYRK